MATDNARFTARELGFPPELSERNFRNLPIVLTNRVKNGKIVTEHQTALLLPSSFALYAIKDPIDSLTKIAATASLLRDRYILPELEEGSCTPFASEYGSHARLVACAAEVLLEAKRKDNENFHPTADQKATLDFYPEGIKSLPAGIWYWTPPFFPYDTNPRLN